jgi:hypothetical protein
MDSGQIPSLILAKSSAWDISALLLSEEGGGVEEVQQPEICCLTKRLRRVSRPKHSERCIACFFCLIDSPLMACPGPISQGWVTQHFFFLHEGDVLGFSRQYFPIAYRRSSFQQHPYSLSSDFKLMSVAVSCTLAEGSTLTKLDHCD